MTTISVRNRPAAWRLPALITLITLAGFALRVHDLGQKSFWYDELRQIEVARMPLAQWNQALIVHAARPLDYAITRFLLHFTRSEWLLRFPALIWGALTTPIVYQIGRRLLGRTEGAIGAFLFALSSLGITFSQELRPYGVYALASAVSFWSLDVGLRRGSRAAWAVYAASLALGVLTHYFWLVIIIGQILYVGLAAALKQLPARRLLPFGLSLAVAGAVLFATADPQVVWPLGQNFLSAIVSAAAANQPPPVSLRGEGFNPFAPVLTYEFFAGRVLAQLGAGRGPALWLFNGLAAIGLLGSIRARIRLGTLLINFYRGMPFLLSWLIIGPSLIFSYLLYRNEIFAMRYILFALPAYLLLVARGIVVTADGLERAFGGRRLAPGLVLAVVAGFGWLNLRDVADYYITPKDDWRRIGRFLQENVQPGDAIFAPDVQTFVEFYFPGSNQFLVYDDSKREAQRTYAQHGRTWFVMSDWVAHDITDTRKVIEFYPGVTFQWDGSAFIKFTHRGESQAEIESEAQTFSLPPPSLPRAGGY